MPGTGIVGFGNRNSRISKNRAGSNDVVCFSERQT